MSLLDSVIEDLRNGNIEIVERQVRTGAYKMRDRNMKAKIVTFHYARHKNGSEHIISKKSLKEYQEILNEKKRS